MRILPRFAWGPGLAIGLGGVGSAWLMALGLQHLPRPLGWLLMFCGLAGAWSLQIWLFAGERGLWAALHVKWWEHLLRLPLPFYYTYRPGERALIGQALETLRPDSARWLGEGAFALGLLSLNTGVLLTGGAGWGFLAWLALWGLGEAMKLWGLWRAQRSTEAAHLAMRRAAGQTIAGMLSLRANAATGYRLPIFAQLHQSLSQQQIGLALWEQVGRALILSLPLFLRPDSLQEGLALLQILWAAWILDSIGGGIMVLAGALSRIGPARDAAQEDQASRQPLPHFRGEIRLQGVTFRYNPGGPAILQGLNFHLRPGECLAIVGETGCGKSTLARLLLAYEVPEAGRLFYDDHPAETLDLSSVRAQIGMVWQDSRLWPGSVKSNLLGQQHLPLSAAWEAARLACIDDLIRDLAMHMMTSLDEGGGIFSKGQQQRLLLARALVHRPRLLILDEALGAIDEATRQKIEANLRALGISRLMIAYRPEEVKTADRVLFMEAGRVVAEGTYAALAASHPGFRRLLLASADSPAAASIPHGAPAPPNSPPIDR